jgi:capsular exopolysaccharide synthesis family protein
MEEQQGVQQLVPEINGKHSHPSLPVYYAATIQESKTDEWDLRQFLAVVRRRAFVIGSVAIALYATAWFLTLSRQPKYEGKIMLLVEPVTAETKLAGLTQIPGTNANSQQEGLDYNTQILVLQSPELMAPIIKQLSTRYPDINYGSLIGSLKISRFQETKILEVSYQDSVPQKIQFILQELARGYLKYSLQQRQTNLRQGIQFVNYQLPQLQERVNNLQKELQRFRQQHNFVDPEIKAEQLSEQVSNVRLQHLYTQNQLAETRAFYKTLQGQSGEQLAQNPALGQTLQDRPSGTEALIEKEAPVYEKLVTQLRELESQIAAELARFRQDSPIVQLLREKRDNLLPVLQKEAERVLGNKKVEVANQISLLEMRAAKIAQAESSLNQQVKQLPILTRQYTDLQRELKIATESLNRFLEKRESLQIEIAQKEIPWQLIAPPQLPQTPISPNVKRNLILGAIASLLAGMGAALLAERLDNVFHSPDDLKELTKLPLLGVIPFHKHLQKLAPVGEASVETDPNGYNLVFRNISKAQSERSFPFLEAFRSLHTNISFLGSDTPIHSLVISSAVHADGKSTVALHLALASAAMGQRVLLVDADLRRPQIHTLLGLSNERGLSNFITTKLPFSKVVRRSPSWNNLYVLTSGQIPPDPTKLLSSKKMRYIMEQFRQIFDLVIYDTPPLLGLADSSLLATHTDGIVLVVRMGKTDRSVLMRALDRLKISRAGILGTVCNGIKNSNDNAYYYYHQPRRDKGRKEKVR